MVITFNDQSIFKDEDGKVMWPQFEVRARIKRQEAISEPQKNVLYGFDYLCTFFILISTAFTALTALLLRKLGGIKRLVSAYKSVMMIVFTMLIKV